MSDSTAIKIAEEVLTLIETATLNTVVHPAISFNASLDLKDPESRNIRIDIVKAGRMTDQVSRAANGETFQITVAVRRKFVSTDTHYSGAILNSEVDRVLYCHELLDRHLTKPSSRRLPLTKAYLVDVKISQWEPTTFRTNRQFTGTTRLTYALDGDDE